MYFDPPSNFTVVYQIEMTNRNVHLVIHEIKRQCAKNRISFGNLPHSDDIINGIFPKYLQRTKKSTTPSSINFRFCMVLL